MSSILSSVTSTKSRGPSNSATSSSLSKPEERRGSKGSGSIAMTAKPLATNNNKINSPATNKTQPRANIDSTKTVSQTPSKFPRSESNVSIESSGSGTSYKMNGHVLKPHQLAVFQEAFNMFDKVS